MATRTRDESRFPLLRRLSSSQQAAILEQASHRSLAAGDTLFHEGDPAEALFVVEEGRIKLTQLTSEGREVIIRFVGPREVFAAMAVLDGKSYPFSATAAAKSLVLSWRRSLLPGLFKDHPGLQANVLDVVGSHARESLERFRELATEPVPQRLARALLRLLPLAEGGPGDGVFVCTITQQDLADMTASTLFTVSRVLSQWESAGVVATGRGKIRVRSRARLTELAGEPAATDR